MRASFRRRLIALVAAYTVALNALLPALALVAPVASQDAALTIICAAAPLDPTSSGGAPVGHMPGCLHGTACLVTGCGGFATLGGETRRASRPVPGEVAVVFAARPSHDGAARRIFDGHFARAPPAV